MAVTNSNFRIMFRNLIDESTLTATPAPDNVATMPVDNVKTLNRTESFRSTAIDAEGVTISGELPAAERVSGIVMNRHNLKPGDTWRFKGWTQAGKTGVLFDTGFVNALMFKRLGELDTKVDSLVTTVFEDPGWDTAWSRMFFGSIVVQSYEFQIISNGNPDGYIDINRLWLARATSLQRNFGYGYELDWKDRSLVGLTEGESTKVDRRGKYREIRITVPRVFDTDRSQITDLIRIALNSNEVFIDLFPEREGKLERDYSMTAVIEDHSPLRSVNVNKHTISLVFRET